MAVNTAAEIFDLKEYLKGKYTTRNSAYATLRSLYNGRYFDGKEIQETQLVINLLAMIVDKYTDYMAQAPDWQVLPVDVSKEATLAADKQEKLLYAQWQLNDIETIQQWQANLQSMLGFFSFEILPNFGSKEKYVNISVSMPEFVLPMPKTDNVRDLDCVIIQSFEYDQKSSLFSPDVQPDQRMTPNITKYFDKDKIVILKDRIETLRIQHDWGIIPVVCGQNRIKPHYVEGIGDLDQVVGLNQYLNELVSWQADIIEYAANPITILKGLVGDVNKLPTGPRAVWNLGPDGSASFLSWPGQAPQVEAMIQRITQAIQDGSNISDPTIGRDIPSGTSGSAVQSLLSGIQSAILRKQITLGKAYVQVNELIFRIIEKMFPNEELTIRGLKKGGVFVDSLKGSEINGNYRNRVIWPAGALDAPARLNVEILKLDKKLQSKITTMEKIGIEAPLDEMKRIQVELEEEIRLAALAENPAGIDRQKQQEFDTAARQLGMTGGPQGPSPEQQLIEAIASIPKIKGSVFFGGRNGDKFTVVLTDMNDKGTILRAIKGDQLEFRKFKEGQDEELTPIIDQEEVNAA